MAGVLVLAGPPCAGKSSVGRLLAAEPTRAVPVEVDAVFATMLPASDRNRQDRMLGYDAAHAVARTVVAHGRTAMLECTYARVEQRASLLAALADVPSVPLWVVEFVVSADQAVERFRRRRQDTDLDEHSLRERVTHPYSDRALRLESTRTPHELADRVAAWLDGGPEPVPRQEWAAEGRGWA